MKKTKKLSSERNAEKISAKGNRRRGRTTKKEYEENNGRADVLELQGTVRV